MGCDRDPSRQLGTRQILKFNITFREAVDPDNYAYVIAFSKTASDNDFTRPSDEDIGRYLPLPGQTLGDGDTTFQNNGSVVNPYYSEFYTAWSTFFIGKGSQFDHIRSDADGGFPSSDNVTEVIHQSFTPDLGTEFISTTLSAPAKTLSVTVIAEDLITSLLTSDLRYAIMTFDRNNVPPGKDLSIGDPGLLVDYSIQTGIITIPIDRGDEIVDDKSNLDESNISGSVPGAADIVSWQVQQF